MSQPLDSRQLRAFSILARTASFTTTAKELHLSQSAISHSMKAPDRRSAVGFCTACAKSGRAHARAAAAYGTSGGRQMGGQRARTYRGHSIARRVVGGVRANSHLRSRGSLAPPPYREAQLPRSRVALRSPQLRNEGQNSRLGGRARSCYVPPMTLKQQIHDLVEELPDNSPLLVEVRETLRMNHAIGEAMADVRAGRTFSAEEFTAKVQERWPRQASA